jgi:carboxypeptidase PM20D1
LKKILTLIIPLVALLAVIMLLRTTFTFEDKQLVSFPLIHQQAQKQVINQHSLIFHLSGKDASLKPALFLAHMDVVPVDKNTQPKWTHLPFAGDISGAGVADQGTIWGRGTMDDKGGLMALMESVELMLKNNIQPNRDIYLAFGHDEEVGGNHGQWQCQIEYFARSSNRHSQSTALVLV